MKILKKTQEEFYAHMWAIYPHDHQLPESEGMRKAYEYLTGVYDFEQKEREEIAKKIHEEMKKKGFH